jgi:hypothetical protein
MTASRRLRPSPLRKQRSFADDGKSVKSTRADRRGRQHEDGVKALRLRQDELEAHLLAAPSTNWCEAAQKARYLLNLFAGSLAAQDPRKQTLIAAVLDDFERLGRE